MIHAVLKGISDALSLEFGYGVYIEEIPQDLQEPCFFISCVQSAVRQQSIKSYFMENQFGVQFILNSQANPNAKCYETAEKLIWRLEIIQADCGSLRGSKMKYEVVDGVLHFFVNYDFYMKKTEEQTVMAELKSQINMKG